MNLPSLHIIPALYHRSLAIHHRSLAPHHRRLARLLLLLMLFSVGCGSAAAQEHLPRYYINRCKDFAATNSWQEVKREVDEGLATYPDDPDLRYYNGRYYYVIGDMREARYQLVRATQEDDQHFASKRLLVDVEDNLKHYSSAICFVNELLEFQPYDRDLWRRKIGLYRKMGNHAEADAALQRLAHIYPNDTIVRNEVRNRNRETWNSSLQKSSLAEAADNLEQWIDMDPTNLEYYVELTVLYERMGEYERALGAVNRGLHYFPKNQQLVSKALGIMTGMGLYAQALTFAKQNGGDNRLYANLLHEVANDARLRDPYESNGRLYALTHDRDALTYLINTSLTRGYDDDARYYVGEAIKQQGRTPRLLMHLYTIEKRAGNEAAMVKLLEELAHKEPIDEDIVQTYADLMTALANRDMQAEQWTDACSHLARALGLLKPEDEAWPSAVSKQITVLGHMGRYADARDLYHQMAAQTDSTALIERFASAYEDAVANRLRLLMQEEQYEAALQEAQALLTVVPRSEVALRTCINASQTLRRNDLFQTFAAQGYDAYPTAPYFIIKQATSLQQQDRVPEALALLRASLPTAVSSTAVSSAAVSAAAPSTAVPSAAVPSASAEVSPVGSTPPSLRPVDGGSSAISLASSPQLIAAHSGISGEWANALIKAHMPDLALTVLDDALVYDSANRELLYTKGVAYEHLKDFRNAYLYQSRYYEPSNAELQEYREHMRYLGFRGFKNRVDASYTYAAYDTKSDALASRGHLYSLATVAYSRIERRDAFMAQVSYKGIDGYHIHTDDYDEDEPGGAGLEFTAQWEHTFNHRWSALVNAAASTRFFNRFGANLSVSYAANHGWTPTLRIGYRRTPETYLYLGDASAVQSRTGEYNLFLISPSVEKSWERIKAGVSVDLTAMESSIYYNVGAKAKLFFNDDNISSVALLAGFGSFPELTFFEQTALQGLSHTNVMVGFDAQYLLTRHLYISLSGSWNTCYNPYRLSDGTLTDSYRNIYSITAQLHVAF